jgi:hypothetical protein
MLVSFLLLLSLLSVGICRQTTSSDSNILTRVIRQTLSSAGIMGNDNDSDDVLYSADRETLSLKDDSLVDRPGKTHSTDKFNYNRTQKLALNTDIVGAAAGFGVNYETADMSNLLGDFSDLQVDEHGVLSILDGPMTMTSFPKGTEDPNIDADCLLECNSNGEENCDFQCTYITDAEYFSIVDSNLDSNIDPYCMSECSALMSECSASCNSQSDSQCYITDAEYLNLVNSNYNCDIDCLAEYVHKGSYDSYSQYSDSVNSL